MKKEVFEKLKKELLYVLIIFALLFVLFNFIFYKENFLVKLRAVLSFFWLFVVPGYILMFYWESNLEFIERFMIGITLAAAITGISSYYLGLSGLNLKYHIFLLPVVLIVAGTIIILKKKYD